MESPEASELTVRLRGAYDCGTSIAEMLQNEPALATATPVDMMWALMKAFNVGLADVSCIDGWSATGDGEVTDKNLDLFIRDAIEQHRAEWQKQ